MLLIGIDQSPKKHDICIIDSEGRQLARGEMSNTLPGFQWIHEQCRQLDVAAEDCLVALESAYSLVVDFLLDHGYQVYVVPGRAVDRYRDRHRQSRSCSDQGDALLLANVLRTDRHQYVPLTADRNCSATVILRSEATKNLAPQDIRRCENEILRFAQNDAGGAG